MFTRTILHNISKFYPYYQYVAILYTKNNTYKVLIPIDDISHPFLHYGNNFVKIFKNEDVGYKLYFGFAHWHYIYYCGNNDFRLYEYKTQKINEEYMSIFLHFKDEMNYIYKLKCGL